MAVPFMLDTEMYTRLQEDAEAAAAFCAPDRALRVLSTHVQWDQVGAAANGPERAIRLGFLNHTEHVPTAGMVWDVSRWDMSTWSSERQAALLDAIAGPNASPRNRLRNAADALIASTALERRAILVMRDHQSVDRALAWGVVVWSWRQFRACLVERCPPHSSAGHTRS